MWKFYCLRKTLINVLTCVFIIWFFGLLDYVCFVFKHSILILLQGPSTTTNIAVFTKQMGVQLEFLNLAKRPANVLRNSQLLWVDVAIGSFTEDIKKLKPN
jgi:hypothetical protein